MATSTRSTTSRARGGNSNSARSKNTKTQATKKYPSVRPVPSDQPGLIYRAWMGLAHLVGGAARVFGKETLAKEDRRDGVPVPAGGASRSAAPSSSGSCPNDDLADHLRRLGLRRPARSRRVRAPGHHAGVRGLAVPASVERARQQPGRHRPGCSCCPAWPGCATSSAASRSPRTARSRSRRAAGSSAGWSPSRS